VVAVVFDQPVEGSVRQGDNSPSVVSCATRFAREKASARVPLRRPELADGWLHDVKPPRSLPIPQPLLCSDLGGRVCASKESARTSLARNRSKRPFLTDSFRLKKPLSIQAAVQGEHPTRSNWSPRGSRFGCIVPRFKRKQLHQRHWLASGRGLVSV
jgi:hypothetical protein